MATDGYGLQDIKKELQYLSNIQLADLVLRLAKHKKENKELLAYLLFVADDEAGFIEQSKYQIGMMFYAVPAQAYNAVKALRKILWLITKLSRFSGSKNVEISLLAGFCYNYLEYIDRRINYKPMRTIFIRQIEKLSKIIAKLHEDIQGDYLNEYHLLLNSADEKLAWFNQLEYKII